MSNLITSNAHFTFASRLKKERLEGDEIKKMRNERVKRKKKTNT